MKIVTKRQAQMALFPNESVELIKQVNEAILDAARKETSVSVQTDIPWPVVLKVSHMLEEVGFIVNRHQVENISNIRIDWSRK